MYRRFDVIELLSINPFYLWANFDITHIVHFQFTIIPPSTLESKSPQLYTLMNYTESKRERYRKYWIFSTTAFNRSMQKGKSILRFSNHHEFSTLFGMLSFRMLLVVIDKIKQENFHSMPIFLTQLTRPLLPTVTIPCIFFYNEFRWFISYCTGGVHTRNFYECFLFQW